MKKNNSSSHCIANRLSKWGLVALLLILFVWLQPTSSIHAATIVVNTTDDEYNSDLAECSLREAIESANSDSAFGGCTTGSGDDIITLPAGIYTLTILGIGEDGNTTGDLDIDSNITINGDGSGVTIIDGNGSDRVIHTHGSANLDLNNLTVQNGQFGTTAGNSGNGGGIYHQSNGTINLSYVDLLNNLAGHRGGGLENAGTATLTNCTISENTSNWGGGLVSAVPAAIMTITNSTISNNNANTRGSGINVYAGNVTVENSTLTGNYGTAPGGGLANSGTLTVRNSTISNNSTTNNGGGIYTYGGTTAVYNSTISNNTSGSGIYISGGTITLDNSIVSGNNAANCNVAISGGTNLEFPGTTCGFSVQADPLLGALADNGGPTETHALLVGSSAIDTGGTCTANDQRGATRPMDGDANGTATCDIGAFELGELQCGILTATEPYTYQFIGNTVLLNVTNDNNSGSSAELDCLRVTDIPSNHPHATSAGNGLALETGKYWIINGLQTGGGSTATNYTLDMTLPHSISPDSDAKICKYPGTQGGYGWDCDRTSSTGTTVTLNNITSLSEWAVGDQVGPTAVSLQSITANQSTGWGVLLISIMMLTIGSLWLRRARQ